MATIKTKLKGFVAGVAAVPASLVGIHLIMGIVSDNYYGFKMPEDSDYSLKYRLETAYSLNTPKEHTQYMVWNRMNSANGPDGHSTQYMATPFATYPAMLLAGLFGARVAARKEDQWQAYKAQCTR